MYIVIGDILWAQQSQQKPTSAPSAQAGRRKFYRNCALAVLMDYVQVYIDSGIPIIWVKFQISKECYENLQDLM